MLLVVLLSVIPSMTCCQEAKFLIHTFPPGLDFWMGLG